VHAPPAAAGRLFETRGTPVVQDFVGVFFSTSRPPTFARGAALLAPRDDQPQSSGVFRAPSAFGSATHLRSRRPCFSLRRPRQQPQSWARRRAFLRWRAIEAGPRRHHRLQRLQLQKVLVKCGASAVAPKMASSSTAAAAFLSKLQHDTSGIYDSEGREYGVPAGGHEAVGSPTIARVSSHHAQVSCNDL
jgi:hypothetical protein